MTEIIYSEKGQQQETGLTIRWKVKHSPGNENHLKTLLTTNNHYIIGKDIYEEDGRYYYEM